MYTLKKISLRKLLPYDYILEVAMDCKLTENINLMQCQNTICNCKPLCGENQGQLSSSRGPLTEKATYTSSCHGYYDPHKMIKRSKGKDILNFLDLLY